MKKINIGIIAHVDSGKTTLSEAILYLTGSIRSLGRVDKGSSFLDDSSIERQRGITIFSKMARFSYGDTGFTLIDTPGHADFSAETERTLRVLDYAVLLISAPDGIKGQTMFLWDLLKAYDVPVFIFVNKMDQCAEGREELLAHIHADLSSSAIDITNEDDSFFEQAAGCSNEALEEYFNSGSVSRDTLLGMIAGREIFPCLFGSALRMDGVKELLYILDKYTRVPDYPQAFGADVYKISRDENGSRLTFIKVTGGVLKNKSLLPDGEKESKVNEIRQYSGSKYTLTDCASAGDICVLLGLKESYAGQIFGEGANDREPLSVPVLSYRVIPPDGTDPAQILPSFKMLAEESPELHLRWDEENHQIYVSVLGQIQLEVLFSIFSERFGLEIGFDTEEILYKETVLAPAVGVGHFEPLRHYAEVHLLIEPAPRGSGVTVQSALSFDALGKNWQSQIINSLKMSELRGVLTGSALTDVNITLTAGRSHVNHSESGDFREAAIRALRQGLMLAENALLEPWYSFILDIPSDQTGRALNDLSLMDAQFGAPETDNSRNRTIIKGRASVRKLKNYPAQVNAYSRGEGNISMTADGYDICKDQEEIVSENGYEPEHDLAFPASSVFCTHGAGYIVPFNEVYAHAHLPVMNPDGSTYEEPGKPAQRSVSDIALGTSDIEKIIAGYAMANSKDKKNPGRWKRKTAPAPVAPSHHAPSKLPAPFSIENADILLVDGYNVIFAWEDLADLASVNIDAARDALTDILNKYASMTDGEVIAVFDAYRVEGHACERFISGKVRVIFTAEDEIADSYIEKFTNENARSKKIAVVTSDGIEQVITRGQGCRVISSREFRAHLETTTAQFNDKYGIG